MTPRWMSEAHVMDLTGSRGNGPFGRFLGVALHVNVDEHGTSDSFWRNNSGQVTPNFQVYKSEAAGGIHQMLPFDWQPWCQINGNFNYAAIETAGLPSEPLTDYQLHAIARILRVYKTHMGFNPVVTNTPGKKGLITHQAGGGAWGGHSCPGTLRANQRQKILDLVTVSHGGKAKPAPAKPASGSSLHRSWPAYMHGGDYFGLITGPAHSHGGYYPAERGDVLAIQKRLNALGYYKGALDSRFGPKLAAAVTAWQHKYMPHTQFYGQIWADDWARLFTY